jgi:hypothetical protein
VRPRAPALPLATPVRVAVMLADEQTREVPMAATPWQLRGQYFETCSCDYLCPCVSSNLAAAPSKGGCTFAMVYHVEQGRYGSTGLDDLNFAIVGYTPGAMAAGDWSVGLIADDRASADQQQALLAIVSGQAGGPLANLSPLIGKFLGVEAHPIQFQGGGLRWSATIPGRLDQATAGVVGSVPDEAICVDNTLHPANARLALARAERSHLHAFGLDWDDDSGQNNGHYAPFQWQVS